MTRRAIFVVLAKLQILSHAIENVYYVNGLKYNLLSVSQICDKGNEVKFMSKSCTVTNLKTGELVLIAKRFKNIYVADFNSLNGGDLTCLNVINDDAELWYRRLGHASFTLFKKLIKKDVVHGLPKSKFKDHKVCDACAKGKQVRSSFKPKKEVSTSRPLDFIHMDLCGSMRIPSKGGKKYIFVIVDDYSRFT
ncbi:putative mitochondrial protein AtMg00300 [Nicotiana tabacum]|uniref:Mitochondrial protein AtMg00300 n=1 Tax=Nicotiana tabacum TaxID=4097 RepID=A0AC58TXD6_TOBAC